jgi:hypothetical protein
MLRAALFLLCGILLAAAGCSAIAGCSLGVVLRLAVPGLVLLFGLVFERWRYKSVTACRPGPGWVATDERFVDPESGKLVTVFYQPATGERRYVAGPPNNSSTDRNEFSWHPNAS